MKKIRIMYIQYSGDFKEAYEHLVLGSLPETYYAQRYSVSHVVSQARNGAQVYVLILHGTAYEVKLENNLVVQSLDSEKRDLSRIKELIRTFSPNRAIVITPDPGILRVLRKEKIPTLPLFADSFQPRPLYRLKWLYYVQYLKKELNNSHIYWIGNHQINAAKSIARLGINSGKIVPYDWVHDDNPENWPIHTDQEIETKFLVGFYAGSLTREKGVFDLVDSVSHIKEAGRAVRISLAGQDIGNELRRYLKNKHSKKSITLLGTISHEEVLSGMASADFVVVPSHHSYPEGLPMTIMESLMTHTPVIASDHPMFLGRVGVNGAVRFFKEQDSAALAKQILLLCNNKQQYKDACINTSKEWHNLCLRMKWADFISRWTENPENVDFSLDSLTGIL